MKKVKYKYYIHKKWKTTNFKLKLLGTNYNIIIKKTPKIFFRSCDGAFVRKKQYLHHTY